MDKKKATIIFEELRKKVENSPIDIDDGQKIEMTISIGVVTKLAKSLDKMVKNADDLLYQAKQNGRNKVVVNSNM